MHPYVIEKLAASRREDLLAGAERHRRRVQARSNQTALGGHGTRAVARIAVRLYLGLTETFATPGLLARLARATCSTGLAPTRRIAAHYQESDSSRPRSAFLAVSRRRADAHEEPVQ